MTEQTSIHVGTPELTQAFEAATNADKQASAFHTLAAALEGATPCNEWDPETRRFWDENCDKLAKTISAAELSNPDTALFIKSCLSVGLDSAILRKLYVALAKQTFQSYCDIDALIEALGIMQESIHVSIIAKRWNVFQATVKDTFCYDHSLGVGIIMDIDDQVNEIKLVCDSKKHNLKLKYFLSSSIVIKKDSEVWEWLSNSKLAKASKTCKPGKEAKPLKMPAQDLELLVRNSVFSATDFPIHLTRALLVPLVLSDTMLKNLTAVASSKNKDEKVETESSEQSATWETSRSLLELSERLKNATKFDNISAGGLESVGNILKNSAAREDSTSTLATSLAILQEHHASFPEDWFPGIIEALADTAVVWQNPELFAKTSDGLSGKQVPAWFEVTKHAKGAQFLIEHTFALPFKLWGHTEKALTPDEAVLFPSMVSDKLKEGKVSADMLYWLLKSKNNDSLKQTYLTNASLIFKTLQREVSGNYLKAQRDLRKMLLDDKDDFRKTIMNNGEEANVSALVRCAKNMPLLDASEKQSLLVKIVRLYPQHIHLVEDRKVTSQHIVIPRVTSYRSLMQRQMELDDIINVQIPENITAIATAREHGDLSENSEFKYAKERQRFLNARRDEFEKSLKGLPTITFRDVVVNQTVVLGCTVVLEDSDGIVSENHILGLLDTIPEKNLLSFETPLAKLLIGHHTGDEIILPSKKKAVIKEIKKLSDDLIDWLNTAPEPIVH